MRARDTTVWLVGTVVLTTALAGAWAASRNCLDKRCAEDQKPPACCKEPPCIVRAHLESKIITQGLFKSPKLRADALQAAKNDPVEAADLFHANIHKILGADKFKERLRECPTDIPPLPELRTENDCTRTAGGVPMNEESALAKLATCREFVLAGYRHEDLHRERCRTTNSLERRQMKIEDFADEEAAGYEIEIQELRKMIAENYRGCTPYFGNPLDDLLETEAIIRAFSRGKR